MVAESQFQKAELKRLKQHLQTNSNALQQRLWAMESQINQLKTQRKQLSDSLQRWLFTKFEMLNAMGERRNLLDIFAPTPQQTPPAGTGECCAPKLLQHAFAMGYRPVCMGRILVGQFAQNRDKGALGAYYPACKGKCGPTLEYMLQGLDLEQAPNEANPQQGALRDLRRRNPSRGEQTAGHAKCSRQRWWPVGWRTDARTLPQLLVTSHCSPS